MFGQREWNWNEFMLKDIGVIVPCNADDAIMHFAYCIHPLSCLLSRDLLEGSLGLLHN